MHDAGNQAVAGGSGNAQVQFTVLVDGAGVELIARAFVRQCALAGDGRLIDRAFAFRHLAIQRHAGAGGNAQHGA